MKKLIGGAVAAVLSVTLLPAAASAETVTVKDKRGDTKRLDLVSVKLNNGKHRLAATFRISKKTMRQRGSAGVAVGYRRLDIQYALWLKWSRRDGLQAKVSRANNRWRNVTKRCDVATWRRGNRVRIGVDQTRCMRNDAGRLRFIAATATFRNRALQDGGLLTFSKPIGRG